MKVSLRGDSVRKKFVVFRCPVCGKFTYAPLGQKTRLCSFCGKIIRIDPRTAVITDDAKQASLLVKRYNLKGGEKSYLEALKAQKERVLDLIEEVEQPSEILPEEETSVSLSKARRMFVMLRERCSNPINIDELGKLCKKYGLEWDWVREQLELLAKEGTVIFPRPWLLQYIGEEDVEGYTSKTKQLREKKLLHQIKNLRRIIASILRGRKEPMSYAELTEILTSEGFTLEEIEETMRKLFLEGLLVEPKPGYFLWVGDL